MKKFFKCLGIGLFAIAIAFGVFFSAFNLNKKDNNNVSYADSSYGNYTFSGSNIYLPTVFCSASGTSPYFSTLVFKPIFYRDGANIILDLSNSCYYTNRSSTLYFNYVFSDLDTRNTKLIIDSSYNLSHEYHIYNFDFINTGHSPFFLAEFDSDFNCNVVKIRFWSYNFGNTSIGFSFGSADWCNVITYTDNNDNDFSIYFYEGDYCYFIPSSSNINYFLFNDRTYLLTTYLSDNIVYQNGYSDGLADNQPNIYNNGYNAGYDIGYGAGHSAGVVDSNDYSFIALIGSVIDVPVQTFKSLLNFNVLGINLLNFALSLFTFAVILFLVRIIKGGK